MNGENAVGIKITLSDKLADSVIEKAY